jgi:hypothetical protein
MLEKKIWPDFDFGQDDIRMGLESYVRKMDPDGIWQLIPVIMRWEKGSDFSEEVILNFIKRFNTECYKVLLFWKFPNKEHDFYVDPTFGRPIGGEVDLNQQSEKQRLLPYLKEKDETI